MPDVPPSRPKREPTAIDGRVEPDLMAELASELSSEWGLAGQETEPDEGPSADCFTEEESD